jgi:hypothetical protein
MTKNYTDEELSKIEEAVDKLPEYVKREIFKTPPKIELPKLKKETVKEPPKKKKNMESSDDTSFMIPPPA